MSNEGLASLLARGRLANLIKSRSIRLKSNNKSVDKLPNMEPFSYGSKTLYGELISIIKRPTYDYCNM